MVDQQLFYFKTAKAETNMATRCTLVPSRLVLSDAESAVGRSSLSLHLAAADKYLIFSFLPSFLLSLNHCREISIGSLRFTSVTQTPASRHKRNMSSGSFFVWVLVSFLESYLCAIIQKRNDACLFIVVHWPSLSLYIYSIYIYIHVHLYGLHTRTETHTHTH